MILPDIAPFNLVDFCAIDVQRTEQPLAMTVVIAHRDDGSLCMLYPTTDPLAAIKMGGFIARTATAARRLVSRSPCEFIAKVR